MIELFISLLMGHAVADFALQSDAMAKGKNRNRLVDVSKIPPGQKLQTVWPYWLGSHALIHGGTVALITGSVWLGVLEASTHFVIDLMKCENITGIHMDQFLHAFCKVTWVLLVMESLAA